MYHPIVISKDFRLEENAAGRVDRDFWGNMPKDFCDPLIFCSGWRAHHEIINNKVETVNEIYFTHAVQSLLQRSPIPDFRYLPDVTYFIWGRLVKKRIMKYLKSKKFDYIDSLGMPHGSHLLALKIKEATGLPWIARFYDPWVDNQFMRYKFQRLRNLGNDIEGIVATNADVIIHNNTHIAKLWSERYGAEVEKKIKVQNMVFDTQRMPDYKPHIHKQGFLIISHIGNLHGVRNAHNLIHGVNKLILKYPEIKENIKINMIGWVPKSDKQLILKYNLQSIFNFTGRIPESQCTKYFLEADLFISIDGEGELDLNYPSKLLNYFYYRRPILGLTLEDSVAAEELDKSGNFHVRGIDVDSIALFLERAFFNYDSLDTFDKDY